MTDKKLVAAAKSGDRLRAPEALRDELAESIANCKSGRDTAALSKRLIETMDRIAEINGEPTQKRTTAEVTPIEILFNKQPKRRKTATG